MPDGRDNQMGWEFFQKALVHGRGQLVITQAHRPSSAEHAIMAFFQMLGSALRHDSGLRLSSRRVPRQRSAVVPRQSRSRSPGECAKGVVPCSLPASQKAFPIAGAGPVKRRSRRPRGRSHTFLTCRPAPIGCVVADANNNVKLDRCWAFRGGLAFTQSEDASRPAFRRGVVREQRPTDTAA